MEVELAAMEGIAMQLTDREKALVGRARECIAAGRLPPTVPTTVVAGSGKSETCRLCDRTIGHGEVQYEFTGDGRTYRLHVRCYSIWQLAANEEDH